jgi:hypothetical protein
VKLSIPVVHVSHQLHVLLDGGNLLSRARLRPTHSEERHLDLWFGVWDEETVYMEMKGAGKQEALMLVVWSGKAVQATENL